VIALEATCDTPVGALAQPVVGGGVRMIAYAGAPDGSAWVRDELVGDQDVGREVAVRLLAAGAAQILASASS
jgi:porphobilinogen deaminase